MEVNVILFATLREFGPPNLKIGESFRVNLDENSNILKLLEKLMIPEDIARIVMVNGDIHTNFDHHLKNEDQISIFPPVGGGNH
ncbi:MAG: MoaD/ThiS family protein [Candidatus Hodarchaeota archaeon]